MAARSGAGGGGRASAVRAGEWLRSLAALVVFGWPCVAGGSEAYSPLRSDPVREPWRWRTHTELAGRGLRAMAEGSDGRMWFGTADGAAVYDGLVWEDRPLSVAGVATPIDHILSTADGVVYVASPRGLFVERGGAWVRVFPVADFSSSWFISDLEEGPDGSIWAATALGALRLQNGHSAIYTSAEAAALLGVAAPEIEVRLIPDAVAPREAWTERGTAGIGVRVVEGNHIALRERGVPRLVLAVAAGGPAERAGIRPGDRISAVDGRYEVSQESLQGPEGPLRVELLRAEGVDGAKETLELARTAVAGSVGVAGVHDVLVMPDGGVAFAMQSGSVLLESEGDWRLLPNPTGAAGRHPRLAATGDGTLWMIFQDLSRRGVFSRAPGAAGWSEERLVAQGLVQMSLSLDHSGALWVGGHSGVLGVRRGGRWVVYDELALRSTRIVEVLHAQSGRLWLAPLGGPPSHLDLTVGQWETYEGLLFQLRSRDGSDWFISEDDGIVRNQQGRWTRYGRGDGVIPYPVRLIEDASDRIWVAGSDRRGAAVSRFDGQGWQTLSLAELSSGVDHRSVYASASGAVWLGARPETPGSALPGGVAELTRPDGEAPGRWRHHRPPEALSTTYGISEAHGYLWTGSYRGLRRFDGSRWETLLEPRALAEPSIDVVHTDARGDLWVGHRLAGVFRFDGAAWQQFLPADGLPEGRVRGFADDGRGGLWVAAQGEYARFDGVSWHASLLSPGPPLADHLLGLDGELWLTFFAGEWPDRDRTGEIPELRSLVRRPEALAPETWITSWSPEVGSPGTNGIAWKGRDHWESTPAGSLEFSWRLDGGVWSAFAKATERTFSRLDSGEHVFEVRARDADFNVDATPARVSFTVVPPAWRQPQVLGLLALLLAAAGWQTLRLVRRDRQLRVANEELERRVELRTRDLAESEHRLSLAIDAVQMATWDWRDGRLGWSPGADRLFGLSEGALAADPDAYRALLAPEDLEKLDARIGLVRRGELDELQGEVRLVGGGAERWLEARGRVVTDLPGSELRVTGVMLDVTERRQAEERRRELIRELEAKNAELERFTYTASHDLKSPLLTIRGFSGSLVADARSGRLDRVEADVDRIAVATDRMQRLLDDLLELSRVGRVANPSERLDLREVAVEAVAALDVAIRESGARVTVQPLPEAMADRTRIVEVFQNLVQNGIKFADPARSPEVVIACRPGPAPVITVSDNGIGIDSRYHDRVFDLFERLDAAAAGTGIGLALARRIVEHHGGRIWVESEGEGRGSTFCFTLSEPSSGGSSTSRG